MAFIEPMHRNKPNITYLLLPPSLPFPLSRFSFFVGHSRHPSVFLRICVGYVLGMDLDYTQNNLQNKCIFKLTAKKYLSDRVYE